MHCEVYYLNKDFNEEYENQFDGSNEDITSAPSTEGGDISSFESGVLDLNDLFVAETRKKFGKLFLQFFLFA